MTATEVKAIQVIPQQYKEMRWLETRVMDADEYLALPAVVEFQGTTYYRTGWNSDTGAAYYKLTGFHAVAR